MYVSPPRHSAYSADARRSLFSPVPVAGAPAPAGAAAVPLFPLPLPHHPLPPFSTSFRPAAPTPERATSPNPTYPPSSSPPPPSPHSRPQPQRPKSPPTPRPSPQSAAQNGPSRLPPYPHSAPSSKSYLPDRASSVRVYRRGQVRGERRCRPVRPGLGRSGCRWRVMRFRGMRMRISR